MKTRVLAILNFVSLAFQLIISYLVQSKIISSQDVGQVSLKYDTVFAPAGITFAIWGLIYIALIAFCIFHLYKAFSKPNSCQTNQDTLNIGWLFIINGFSTGLWLIAWVNEELFLSVILILVQLLTLIMISVAANISDTHHSLPIRVFTHFPLSIYWGWICIASIANISVWLKSAGWDAMGLSETSWVIILIGIAIFISLFIILFKGNIAFGLVFLWALYGIVIKRQSLNPVEFESVIYSAYSAMVIILIALCVRIFRRISPNITAN